MAKHGNMDNDGPSLVSNDWKGNAPSVSRSDIMHQGKASTGVKGIKTRMSYGKDQFRRTPGTPPGGDRGTGGREPVK